MEKNRNRVTREIFLFESECPKRGRLNVLKEFIYFLKFNGKRGKIDFSFSGNEESAHSALTIKDNYILDSVPTSLIKDKEDNFMETAQGLANEHLKLLIQETEELDRLISELETSEKKLVSIVKSILSTSEYLFLDAPDEGISQKVLEMVKSAIIFEVDNNNRKIFIKPGAKEKWLDLATHIITKNEKNQYVKNENNLLKITPVPNTEIFQTEAFDEEYKKAS